MYCDECGEDIPDTTPPRIYNPRKGEVYHCDDCAALAATGEL